MLPMHTSAPGIVSSIKGALTQVKLNGVIDKLVGINIDGASMNLGNQKGVGMLKKPLEYKKQPSKFSC